MGVFEARMFREVTPYTLRTKVFVPISQPYT
jgi:hypothetical protein